MLNKKLPSLKGSFFLFSPACFINRFSVLSGTLKNSKLTIHVRKQKQLRLIQNTFFS